MLATGLGIYLFLYETQRILLEVTREELKKQERNFS